MVQWLALWTLNPTTWVWVQLPIGPLLWQYIGQQILPHKCVVLWYSGKTGVPLSRTLHLLELNICGSRVQQWLALGFSRTLHLLELNICGSMVQLLALWTLNLASNGFDFWQDLYGIVVVSSSMVQWRPGSLHLLKLFNDKCMWCYSVVATWVRLLIEPFTFYLKGVM